MSVTRLHHVNICTDDVAASARYYAELFDLEAKNATGSYPPDMVQWMYTEGGQPIIHLFKHRREQGSTGVIHHIALDCDAGTQEQVPSTDSELLQKKSTRLAVAHRRPHCALFDRRLHED